MAYEAIAQQFGITIDPMLQQQINEGLLCDWRSMVQKNVVSRQIAARKGRPSGWPDLTSQKVLLEASQNVLLGDPNMYMGNPMQTANQALPAQPPQDLAHIVRPAIKHVVKPEALL